MSSPQFLIDDADPLVTYSPGWQVEDNFLGALPGPGTRHGALAATNNSSPLSATLRFRGMSLYPAQYIAQCLQTSAPALGTGELSALRRSHARHSGEFEH